MLDVQTGRPAPSVTALPMPHVAGVEHHFVDVDGLRLHYAEAGAGNPVVLLHGWPQHWWSWREIIGPLSEHHRVICPDTRGMGWSQGGADDYSLHRLAADLVGILDTLEIERAHVVGHDWGCLTAYRAGLSHPERIDRLVPLAGAHPWAASGSPPRVYLRPWHVYAAAALGPYATTRLGIPESSLRTWRHAGRFTPEEIQIYMGALRRPAAAKATQLFDRNVVLREIPHFVRRHRGYRMEMPILHLNGERDPLTRALPHSYRRYAPGMKLVEIPSCGHFIPEEAPDVLVEHLLAFLGG